MRILYNIVIIILLLMLLWMAVEAEKIAAMLNILFK
jgi:hypothetical protein